MSELPSSTPLPQINVTRPLYQQQLLKEDARYRARSITLRRTFRKIIRNCDFGGCLRNILPIIDWLPKYKIKEYLLDDFVAAISTTIIHIPQGMAYAILAAAPPIMGLYMAFFPVLIYVILGNSPHVSIGSFAVTSLMAGKVVHQKADRPLENGVTYTPIQINTALAALVGTIQLIMWMSRMGAISKLLSEPMVSGFTTAAAFHVAVTQLRNLFGINIPPVPSMFNFVITVYEVCKQLPNTNLVALTLSFFTCLFLAINNDHIKPWLRKHTRIPIPAELILVIIGILLSKFLDLNGKYDVAVVGHIPTGFPQPEVPPFELFGDVFADGFMQTLVTYILTLSVGLIFANKEKYEIDADQELLAMGASNVFGSFFSCGPICTALSRSYVQYAAGGKTIVTSMICVVFMLLILLWLGPVFELLPRSVLGSIVIVSLKGLFMQLRDIIEFCRLSKIEALVWIVTFLVTLVVGIEYGLITGLLSGVLSLFYRSQTAYMCLLGRLLQTDIYLDLKRYAAAREIPGIKIFHYSGAINFISKAQFHKKVLRKIYHQYDSDDYPDETNMNKPVKLQCVIFDASGLSYIDVSGIRVLLNIQKELAADEIILLFACVSDPIRECIEKFNMVEREKLNMIIFPTIHDGVLYYQNVIATKALTA